MKKIFLGLLLVGFMYQSFAQDVILFKEKLKTEEVPVEIVKSVEEDFPGFVVEEYTAIPVEFIEDDVIIDRNIKSKNDYNSFQVILKNKREKLTATYNKTGELISEVAYGKNVKLPQSIRNIVAKSFPGWVFVKDSYKMTNYTNGKRKERYKIIINKGNQAKKIIIDASGNIISVHKKSIL